VRHCAASARSERLPCADRDGDGRQQGGIKKLDENATEARKRDAAVVELGDTIEVTMTGLPGLVAEGDCRKSKGFPKRTPILFLAAQPMKGIIGYPPEQVQAGIWFLVILGAYILIVAVTHDISGTVNATALTLMVIGAATMVDSAAIQTNQGEVADAEGQGEAARQLAQRIQELKASLARMEKTAEGATTRNR
jgi:hypothetical protein